MATIINERDLALQGAVTRTVSVNLGPNVNVDGTVGGTPASTVVSNAATAAAHAASSGNPHGVTLTQISGDLDDINNGVTYFRTNANQVTGAGRGFNALNSSSEYIKSLKSTQLTVVGSNPSTGWVGDVNGIRMYQSGTLKVNIPVSGDPYFEGNISGGSSIDITGAGRFQGNSGGSALIVNSSGNATGRAIDSFASGTLGSAVFGTATASSQIAVGGLATSVNAVAVSASNNAGGTALRVSGNMTITSTVQVSNLNADMVDGKHASSLCSVVVPDTGTCTVAGNGFNLVSTVGGIRVRGNNSNGLIIENFSDERLKSNISNEMYGLQFINKLRPVSYRLKASPKIQYHGFIAQEVAKLIKSDDDSLFQIHDDGIYGVDYLSLISPIVKAIQQLSEKVSLIENNGGYKNGR